MPTAKEMIERLSKIYKPEETVAYDVYNVADVMSYLKDIDREDVTEEEAEQALEDMHDGKDCNNGFCWDVLMCYIPSREQREKENALTREGGADGSVSDREGHEGQDQPSGG